jgi:hypothetical protein
MRPAESTAEKMTGMARLGRFERPTSGSGDQRSIRAELQARSGAQPFYRTRRLKTQNGGGKTCGRSFFLMRCAPKSWAARPGRAFRAFPRAR